MTAPSSIRSPIDPLPHEFAALPSTTESLAHSENRFFSVFMGVPVGIAVTDARSGRVVEVNDECVRILGFTRAEAIAHTSMELGIWFDPSDRERTLADTRTVGEVKDAEISVRAKDGTERALRYSAHVIGHGDDALLVSTFVDITPRRRIERALATSERRLGAIFRDSPVALAISELQTGCFTEVNAAFVKLFNTTSEMLIGRRSCDLGMYEPGDRERMIDAIVTQNTTTHTLRMARVGGDWFTAQLSMTPYEIDGVQYLLTSVEDVTQQLQADEERRRAENQYRELVDGVRDIVFSVLPDGTLTSLNPAFETITGLPVSEWLGRPFAGLVHPEDLERARMHFASALANQPRTPTQLRLRQANEQYRIVEITANPRAANGRVVGAFGIARDVSERVRLETELRQSQKMEAVGQLAGGIAHDFNNLLTVIVATGQLVLQDLNPVHPSRPDIDEMLAAAQRAAELTRQLLAFSRRDTQELKVVQVNEVLTGMERLLGRLLGEDVTLVTMPAADLGLVRADAGQLEQVIANLAVNARDAMPNGGILTMSTANVVCDEQFVRNHPGVAPGAYVRISVADTGIGMSEEVRSRVFEPFFTTKDTGKGTGLGLSTVYGIVTRSGGFVDVQSTVGEGSTFSVFLQRVEALEDDVTTPATDVRSATEALNGTETILVVEDEPAVRELIVRVLRRYGYNVLIATNGQHAIDVAAGHGGRIDLLLTDVVMPRLSGVALAEALVERDPAIRVLLLSGYMKEPSLPASLASRVTKMQKPFAPLALARKVRQLLAGG